MNIDQKLIADCINRKSTAEYDLYKITYSYLMSICIRYTKSENKAKEVLNIGFYRVLSNLEKYQPAVPFKAWIRKVMINTLINEFKKEKIHYNNVEYVDQYVDTSKHADVNQALTKLDLKEIYRLIAKLPLVNQQIFNLYFIDGFKHREIAEMLGLSENTSKWHLTIAKEKLREMINKVDLLEKVEK